MMAPRDLNPLQSRQLDWYFKHLFPWDVIVTGFENERQRGLAIRQIGPVGLAFAIAKARMSS